MGRLRTLVRTSVWLLPASILKNRLLTALGHQIHPSARVAPNLVIDVKEFRLAAETSLGRFNMFRHLNSVEVCRGARIGQLNKISSHPVYKKRYPSGARLRLEEGAKITSHHTVDCSGGLTIGEFASVAGRETLVLCHSIDLERDAQSAYPVSIGARSFVGARCLLLGGAQLPDRSVLAAGSVLGRRSEPGESGVWAGVPATFRKPREGAWFERSATSTKRVFVPETGELIEDAF